MPSVRSGDHLYKRGSEKSVGDVSEECFREVVFFHSLGVERMSGGFRDTRGQLRISCKATVNPIQAQVTDEEKRCSPGI